MEAYAIAQDLVFWTRSQIKGRPTYDIKRKTWKVVIDRDGDEVQIEPHHIIVATGVLGSPNMPQLLNHETFSGKILHQTEYPGGPSFKGKHVVVVGAGNSAVDICQDLHHHQAKSVTIVQRSSSCVADGDNAVKYMSKAWPPGVPVEIGDFKFASLPLGLLKKLGQGIQDLMWDEEKVLHGKLRKGGIELNMGPDNSGQFMMVWERCGGMSLFVASILLWLT